MSKSDIYLDTSEFIECIVDDYDYYSSLIRLMKKGNATVSLSDKSLKKKIDETWVSIIEKSLPAIENVTRNFSKTIKEEEKVLPIELSRNVSARSVRHLAQHTDYIKDMDENGNITPSKILNVFREEDVFTYENKFVNTLIDRLFLFVDSRYENLYKQAKDISAKQLELNVNMKANETDVAMKLTIETKDKGNKNYAESDDLWERVKNIKAITTAYKTSAFAKMMGNAYVRPPIMRTNAITKNQYLRQCLNLWQFIESYENVGYEITSQSVDERPNANLIKELYSLLAFQYVIFRENTYGVVDENIIKKAKPKSIKIAPKFVKTENDTDQEQYDIYTIEQSGRIVPCVMSTQKRLTNADKKIKAAIELAIKSEKQYQAQQKKNTNRSKK